MAICQLHALARGRSNVCHAHVALAPLGGLPRLIVAQMANVTLDTTSTRPLQIAGHVRAPTVYAGVIDLAPLLLALAIVLGGVIVGCVVVAGRLGGLSLGRFGAIFVFARSRVRGRGGG